MPFFSSIIEYMKFCSSRLSLWFVWFCTARNNSAAAFSFGPYPDMSISCEFEGAAATLSTNGNSPG